MTAIVHDCHLGLISDGLRDNVVTFASVHFKTARKGGAVAHGFPDPGYLERVSQELDAVGVTDADVMGFGGVNPTMEQQYRDVKLSPAASKVLTMLPGDSTSLSALDLRCSCSQALMREPVVWHTSCDVCDVQMGPGHVRFTCEKCDTDVCAPCAVSGKPPRQQYPRVSLRFGGSSYHWRPAR